MTATSGRLIVLAAGGTGGHVFPAEALAAELAGRGFDLTLVTDARGRAIRAGESEVPTHRIKAGGIAGKTPWGLARGLLDLALGALQAFKLLGGMVPRAVVGFGGYASFPTMLAARLRGLPTAIHEQNAVLGRTNRLLARWMDGIAVSFAESRGVPAAAAARAVCTGMPVRPAVVAAPYRTPDADGPINLFVIGGSQGAHIFSTVVPAAIVLLPEALRRRLVVVQQCRAEDMERTRTAYQWAGIDVELSAFFTDAPQRMAAAHLVISRSGASSVAELAAIGRPAILVPYRFAADDHQTANARAATDVGAGWLMREAAFTAEALAERLGVLLGNPGALRGAAAAMAALARPDAVRALADMVVRLASPSPEHRSSPP